MRGASAISHPQGETMDITRPGAAGEPPLSRDTLAVHPWAAAEGRPRAHRTLNAPLYLSTQWESADLPELADLFARDQDRGFYTRFGHPTIRMAEERLAALEDAEDALLFSSGMGAIS